MEKYTFLTGLVSACRCPVHLLKSMRSFVVSRKLPSSILWSAVLGAAHWDRKRGLSSVLNCPLH